MDLQRKSSAHQYAQATTQTTRKYVPEDPCQRLDRRQFGCQSVLFVQESAGEGQGAADDRYGRAAILLKRSIEY